MALKLSNGCLLEYGTSSGVYGFDGYSGYPWERLLMKQRRIDPTLTINFGKTISPAPITGNLRMWNPLGCVRLLYYEPGRLYCFTRPESYCLWLREAFSGSRLRNPVNGVVNAVGLTNPGYEWWCKTVGRSVNRFYRPLVFSAAADTPEELIPMIVDLQAYDIIAIELNMSCANTSEDFCTAAGRKETTQRIIDYAKAASHASWRHPILLKLSPLHNINAIIEGVVDCRFIKGKPCVEAISLNAVPWKKIFLNFRSPLARLGDGAVSGKVAQTVLWPIVEKIVQMKAIPVIGPSVWDYEDMQNLWDMGVGAISFGSVIIPYPDRPKQFLMRDKERRSERLIFVG